MTIVDWTSLLFARATRTQIIWTAHNSFPHDAPQNAVNRFLWTKFISFVQGVIFLSEESRNDLTLKYPHLSKIPSVQTNHGHYGPWLSEVSKHGHAPTPLLADVIRQLDDAFTIFSFGQLLRYKNMDGLMNVFAALPNGDLRLLIAGTAPDLTYRSELETIASKDRRVAFIPKHLDDRSLVACLARADLVVLPYKKILNSGSILLAFGAEKHVLAPAIGSMRNLQQEVGAGAISLYDGPLSSDILDRAIERVRTGHVHPANLREFEWPSIAQKTIKLYREVLCSG